VALRLKKQGITRIRPLAGGIEAWRRLRYPVDPVPVNETPVTVS
jgi:hypothetical protein